MVAHLNENELYQAYLTSVYQNTKGYQHYSDAAHQQFRKENINITYGELFFPSVNKILKAARLSKTDTFLDLGSGLGKCALQVFMMTNVHKIIAIEASIPLYQQAQFIYETVKESIPFFWEEDRESILICDNFLNADWQDTTVAYTCSTCFTSELLVLIGDKINQHPKIQQVFSLRPLPTIRLPLKKVFGVECSWDSALCFHYANG